MSDAMNGAPIGAVPPIQMKNPVVEALEAALAAAKAGQIHTVALIMIDANGNVQPVWAGGRLGDVHLGCSLIQYRLMAMFHGQQQQSRILRPMG